MSHYDVIVIGSGAGGGTLVHRLAPSGKRILLLERGDWLPREPQNWSRGGRVRRQPLRLAGHLVRRETARPFQPQIHYFVGGATKLYGAALYRLREEDFGELRHHDGISPAWPIGYDEFEPYYTQAEQLYQVHGARGRGPDRAARERAVSRSRPSPTSRASSSSPTTSRPPGCTRSTRRAASCSTRPTCRTAAACAARPATASRASCTPSPTPRCWRCGRRSSTPNVTLLTNARAVRARDQRRPARRSPRWWSSATARSETFTRRHRRRLLRRGQLGQAAARLGRATRTRTASPTASDQVGRNYMFHNSQAVLALSKEENPTVFQKTLGLNDFYFGSGRLRVPAGEHPDGRQVLGADMYRGEKPLETKLAPHADARERWRATRSTSGSPPRTCRGPTTGSRSTATGTSGSATRRPTTSPRSACSTELKSMLGHLGMHEDHLVPRHAYLKNEIPVAGVAHQAGTCRFGTDPATSVLNRTAGPTSSTTSTSSTRASSRASAR